MKIIAFLAIFFSLFNISVPFQHRLSTRTYVKKINNKDIKVTEPIKVEKKDTYSIIFLTGGNNIMTNQIYSDFTNTLASHKFSVNFVPANFNNYQELVSDLNKDYKGVITLQHSSSTILSVEVSKLASGIKKLIFLDPVDNRIFFKEYRKLNNKIELKNAKGVLFLKAENAYKWSLKPLIIPFIPFLGLEPNSFQFNKKCKVTTIEAKDFGHTDILDKTWGDFMHNSRFAVGNQNRDYNFLHDYHVWLSKIIHYFCYHNSLEIDNILKSSEIDFNKITHQ